MGSTRRGTSLRSPVLIWASTAWRSSSASSARCSWRRAPAAGRCATAWRCRARATWPPTTWTTRCTTRRPARRGRECLNLPEAIYGALLRPALCQSRHRFSPKKNVVPAWQRISMLPKLVPTKATTRRCIPFPIFYSWHVKIACVLMIMEAVKGLYSGLIRILLSRLTKVS